MLVSGSHISHSFLCEIHRGPPKLHTHDPYPKIMEGFIFNWNPYALPINPYPWSIPRAYPAVTTESRCHRESLVRTWHGRNRSCPFGSVSSSNFRSPPWFPLLRITLQISVGQFWLRLISSSIHILTTTKRTKCESSKLKKTYRVWVFIRSIPKTHTPFQCFERVSGQG